jgi:2-oxo-4-hydroxy-4-carboxy-5-ureidoimidazoline decarboxylase
MAGLPRLNKLPELEAHAQLLRCCGAPRWAEGMMKARPFKTEAELFMTADKVWLNLEHRDWLDAFAQHPRIGGKDALRAKFSATKEWATGEQAGVGSADEEVLDGLARGNEDYERKFGYIFIVCATGKTAAEMLKLLRDRLGNDRQSEIVIAAEEQRKITRLRLEKLLAS